MNLSELNIINTISQTANYKEFDGLGIGDDCAVLPLEGDRYKVVTTDTLTEDSHFIFDSIKAEDLAYKSLASNISDILAMGAKPLYAFLAISYSSKVDRQWIERFSSSLISLANECGVMLLGGDTTFSPHALTITITLIGEVKKDNLKLRSGAKVGDKIFCCNALGGSSLGLRYILNKKSESFVSLTEKQAKKAIEAHYRPKLFLKEAIWLGKQSAITAMMDISDGIAKDLTHILDKSGVSASINIDSIPIFEGATVEDAVSGGEEYSLLFTVDSNDSERVKSQYNELFDGEIYEIGTITSSATDSKNRIDWVENGQKIDYHFKGYEHGNR
ncbi:MAG: thiamine-phosphate kinase [Rikenellaceae bacterium]